jgi:FKBP-type peptidyl-prolyl cis-trans isomerase
MMAKAQAESQKKGEGNKVKGEKFLAENKNAKGVTTTASGLQYSVIKEGTGPKPTASSTVKVHYTGKLLDGTTFDSSVDRGEPVEFPLNGVIPGWTEGLQLMNKGAKYKLYIPANLAYGDRGAGNAIGPNETLIFEVELLEIK